MIDEEGDADGLAFLGRSPFGQWTKFHDSLAEKARDFLASFANSDLREFEQKLDGFLVHRAQMLGCRILSSRQPRWITPSGSYPGILSDVHLFATSFSEGTEWEELRSLLQEIRPIVKTEPETKRAASNEPLAFTVLLMLLADRAGRCYDGEAIEKTDAILSSLGGTLCVLAWRGADALEDVERLRAQAPKASAARSEKAAQKRAIESQLIRDELERLRQSGKPRHQAAKLAAATLSDHPTFNGLKLDSLLDRCREIRRTQFPDWKSARPMDASTAEP